jgi:hypothetical protein
MDKDKAREILEETLAKWDNADKSDGYLYEKNFRGLMDEMNRELFALSTGEHGKDRNTKKKWIRATAE